MKAKSDPVLSAKKKIRLGLWGLGRGMSFFDMCHALNIDVVAGCDFNEHMRARFSAANPGARVTDNADEFLSWDFDAVLVATFCPAHAGDAIKCLAAGKHVLSEVTAFHTMAEGVRLVEAVKRSKRVYNLAENYPFSAPHMTLAQLWKQGVFGDLIYAEGEYVHEVRSLCFTYIDGVPVEPGYALHNWRSWLNFHYYCTHSLGPIMNITGTRPVRVVSLPGKHCLAGYPFPLTKGLGGIAPSLISMNNGAVVKNLMGGTTNDTHLFRYWGTKGSAEATNKLVLRLGGSGESPKMEVKTGWGEFSELAATAGHGGGDFWVMYYFARQIVTGEPAPFEIYAAADVTIPGILAYRSSAENGTAYDVPDFRKKKERDGYRKDHCPQPHYDVTTSLFPKKAVESITRHFNATMAHLIHYGVIYRNYADWLAQAEHVEPVSRVATLAQRVVESHEGMVDTMKRARAIADVYPRSEAARLLREMLEYGGEDAVMAPGFLAEVKKTAAKLGRLKQEKV